MIKVRNDSKCHRISQRKEKGKDRESLKKGERGGEGGES